MLHASDQAAGLRRLFRRAPSAVVALFASGRAPRQLAVQTLVALTEGARRVVAIDEHAPEHGSLLAAFGYPEGGDLLGALLGVDSNVGGVGFAMLMLIVLSDWMRRNGHLPPLSEQGVLYWSAMYIPIVVAMASTQNVVSAVSGGPVALLAGVGATVVCWALVPAVARIGGASEPLPPATEAEAG